MMAMAVIGLNHEPKVVIFPHSCKQTDCFSSCTAYT